jgi:hypothetical protein
MIDEAADKWAFLVKELNVETPEAPAPGAAGSGNLQ